MPHLFSRTAAAAAQQGPTTGARQGDIDTVAPPLREPAGLPMWTGAVLARNKRGYDDAYAIGLVPVFQREGDDLHCEIPISFVKAALGGDIEVPTLSGKASFTIPDSGGGYHRKQRQNHRERVVVRSAEKPLGNPQPEKLQFAGWSSAFGLEPESGSRTGYFRSWNFDR